MALSAAAQEAIWLQALLKELTGYDYPQTIVNCDNKGAVDLSKINGYKARTKHIDIRHHFVRDCVFNGQLKVESISTTDMVADSLTRSVPQEKNHMCDLDGIAGIVAGQVGGC